MKKTALFIIAILCFAALVWFYYYQYVEEVTDRYLVKYTLPHENKSVYGSYKTELKVGIVNIPQYKSDSIAVRKETTAAESYNKKLLEKFEKENFKDGDEFMNNAKRNAYIDLLLEKRMIISLTHVRNMDAIEALDIIKKHGIFSKDVKEYGEKNKLKVNLYPL